MATLQVVILSISSYKNWCRDPIILNYPLFQSHKKNTQYFLYVIALARENGRGPVMVRAP